MIYSQLMSNQVVENNDNDDDGIERDDSSLSELHKKIKN